MTTKALEIAMDHGLSVWEREHRALTAAIAINRRAMESLAVGSSTRNELLALIDRQESRLRTITKEMADG